MRDLFREFPILSIIIFLCLFTFAFFILDGLCSRPNNVCGEIVDKNYKADHSAVGFNSNPDGLGGQSTTVIIDPEEFLLMVRLSSREIVTATCDPEMYYSVNIGELISVKCYKGLFTKIVYFYTCK